MITQANPKFNFTHFFLIIIIINRCSGMFHVPGFNDSPNGKVHFGFSHISVGPAKFPVPILTNRFIVVFLIRHLCREPLLSYRSVWHNCSTPNEYVINTMLGHFARFWIFFDGNLTGLAKIGSRLGARARKLAK